MRLRLVSSFLGTPVTPVATVRVRCQECQGTDEAICGGMQPGHAATFLAKFINDFERNHQTCYAVRDEDCPEDCQYCMGEACRLCPNSHSEGGCYHDSADRHGWFLTDSERRD